MDQPDRGVLHGRIHSDEFIPILQIAEERVDHIRIVHVGHSALPLGLTDLKDQGVVADEPELVAEEDRVVALPPTLTEL